VVALIADASDFSPKFVALNRIGFRQCLLLREKAVRSAW